MDDRNINYKETPLATIETTTEKRKCECCGKELPLSLFRTYSRGYRNVCMACERNENGISEKFKNFTSRELIEELRSRGYKGTLKFVKVEEVKL